MQRLSDEIAERTRAEKALMESEARYREILENSPMGVAVVTHAEDDAQITGDRLFVNEALVKMFGLASAEDMLGADISNSWVSLDQLRKVEEIMTGQDELVDFEALRRRVDGTEWWVSMNSRPIRFDGRGCTMVWHFDITERKRAEEALREAHENLEQRVEERTSELNQEIQQRSEVDEALRNSEARFKDFAEGASDWFWEMDENLRYTYHSPRYFEITGFRPEDKIGTTCTRYVGQADIDRDADKWAAHMKDLEARRPFKNFEFAFNTKDGATINARISGTSVFDAEGNFQGYRGTGANITERKKAETELIRHRDHLQGLVEAATKELKANAEELKEALEKEKELNKLQREFVSMVSHEFRTPLAIIDTTAQRLKRRADSASPEEAVKRADKIRAAVQRMTRLMDSTLSAARIEEGKIKVEIKPCYIGNVVQEVCARQQEMSQTHVISCDLADLPVTIQADTGSLEQVLTNLLSNAVKYAPNAPDIEVMVHTQGDQVVISVRDHGIGIDQEDLSRIGERFFRARTSTGIAGTGIGLNLVKKLVEMHDGTVSVESTKGEGSTFTIRLPIAGPDQTEQINTRVA